VTCCVQLLLLCSKGSLNISLDFSDLGRVIRNRRRLVDEEPCDWQVVDICFTIIMSKPSSPVPHKSHLWVCCLADVG
jgi:hypothetical protein